VQGELASDQMPEAPSEGFFFIRFFQEHNRSDCENSKAEFAIKAALRAIDQSIKTKKKR
jgi:hypothetical protein